MYLSIYNNIIVRNYPLCRGALESEDIEFDFDSSLGFLAGLSVPRDVRFLFEVSRFGLSSFIIYYIN